MAPLGSRTKTRPTPHPVESDETMLLIRCPYCGERPETEFHYGGEAHIARPEDPSALDDEAWADFLFMRGNAKGGFRERWCHSAGCRKWFNVVRDTHTHQIIKTYKIGDKPPALPSERKKPVRATAAKPAAKAKAPARRAAAKG